MFSGLLVKRDLMLLPLELKACRILWSGDVMCGGVSADLLKNWPAALGLRHTWPRRAVLEECRWVGLGEWSLGSQCSPCAVYCSRFVLWGSGGKCHQPTPLFLERGHHTCWCQGSTLRRVNNLPHIQGSFQRAIFTLCLSLECLHARSSALGFMPPKTAGF